MPADPLTKVKDITTFEEFRKFVLGHLLLENNLPTQLEAK